MKNSGYMYELIKVFNEHQESSFPDSLKGKAVEGINVVKLDEEIIEIISHLVYEGTCLEQSQKDRLTDLLLALNKVLTKLHGSSLFYFDRLAQMAFLALE